MYSAFEKKLDKYEPDIIIKAFDKAIMECKFFPSVAEIIEFCNAFNKLRKVVVVQDSTIVSDKQLNIIIELFTKNEEVSKKVADELDLMLDAIRLDRNKCDSRILKGMIDNSFKYIAVRRLFRKELEEMGYEYKGDVLCGDGRWISWDNFVIEVAIV